MNDIEKKIKKLEERIEKLERGEKPYESRKRFNPYDLSDVAKLRMAGSCLGHIHTRKKLN